MNADDQQSTILTAVQLMSLQPPHNGFLRIASVAFYFGLLNE